MSGTRALAAAQTVSRRGQVATNVEQHLRLAHLAADAHARVVVFPELSLTGYELGLARELAFTPQDRRLAPLVEAAAARDVHVVVGAPVLLGDSLHVAALILGPDRTVDVYTKHHLGAFSPAAAVDGVVPPPERTVFEPGASRPLVGFGGHVAAVALCADTAHPSHPAAAASAGADTYLASMFVIPSALSAEAANLRALARRHSLTVVMANHGGATGGLAASGGSAIWSGSGEMLGRLDARGAGVLVAIEGSQGWSVTARRLPHA